MEIHKVVCDKCGREMTDEFRYNFTIQSRLVGRRGNEDHLILADGSYLSNKSFDLCKNCTFELMKQLQCFQVVDRDEGNLTADPPTE